MRSGRSPRSARPSKSLEARAIGLLARREYARAELRDRLLASGAEQTELDGVLDRLADAGVIAGLAVWALESGGRPASIVLLAVAATAGSILSMASKDRVAALRIPPAPERWIGFLLGGRDARLLLVAIGALLGLPKVVLAAVAITSGLSLAARLLFTRAALRA